MKRCIICILSCLLLCSLCACAGNTDYKAKYPDLFSDKDSESTVEVKNIFLQMTENFNSGKYNKYIKFMQLSNDDAKSYIQLQKEIAKTIQVTYSIQDLEAEEWNETYIVLYATKLSTYTNKQSGETEQAASIEKYTFEKNSKGDWIITSSSESAFDQKLD